MKFLLISVIVLCLAGSAVWADNGLDKAKVGSKLNQPTRPVRFIPLLCATQVIHLFALAIDDKKLTCHEMKILCQELMVWQEIRGVIGEKAIFQDLDNFETYWHADQLLPLLIWQQPCFFHADNPQKAVAQAAAVVSGFKTEELVIESTLSGNSVLLAIFVFFWIVVCGNLLGFLVIESNRVKLILWMIAIVLTFYLAVVLQSANWIWWW